MQPKADSEITYSPKINVLEEKDKKVIFQYKKRGKRK